jgi:hypothetical protein
LCFQTLVSDQLSKYTEETIILFDFPTGTSYLASTSIDTLKRNYDALKILCMRCFSFNRCHYNMLLSTTRPILVLSACWFSSFKIHFLGGKNGAYSEIWFGGIVWSLGRSHFFCILIS